MARRKIPGHRSTRNTDYPAVPSRRPNVVQTRPSDIVNPYAPTYLTRIPGTNDMPMIWNNNFSLPKHTLHRPGDERAARRGGCIRRTPALATATGTKKKPQPSGCPSVPVDFD